MVSGRFPFVGATPQEVAAEGLAGRIRFTDQAPWTSVSQQGKVLVVQSSVALET